MAYPQALALTLAVEVPIYVTVFRLERLLPWVRSVAVAVGVNLVTHPLVWLILAHWSILAAVEVGAWLVESALIYALTRRALGSIRRSATDRRSNPWRHGALICLTALVANLASLLAGSLLS